MLEFQVRLQLTIKPKSLFSLQGSVQLSNSWAKNLLFDVEQLCFTDVRCHLILLSHFPTSAISKFCLFCMETTALKPSACTKLVMSCSDTGKSLMKSRNSSGPRTEL